MSQQNMIANRYEVIQHIGQGGMADVFLAVDTVLNRHVAIKILRGELCTDATSVLRFEREAQAATALSHPNIVEIYDVGEYNHHHYIVMEYVPGQTLKKVILSRHGVTNEEAIDMMKQLCSAVAEAHNRGIIHRDIKPQNVIVKADGTVKILDFGIALAKGSMQLTQANNVMGSVHYLAPELAKGESATVQSDIYALGIVLYEMLTGEVPFKADNAVQVALMHMRNPMPSVKEIVPGVPQSVENVIIRATAKNPGLRYRNCNEMLEDLRTSLQPERMQEPRIVLAATQEEERTATSRVIRRPAKRLPDSASTMSETTNTQARIIRPAVQKPEKSHKGILAVLITLLVVLILAASYFALRAAGFFGSATKMVTVPDLTNITLVEAQSICTENNLVLDTDNVTYTLTESTSKGNIIEVVPSVGSEVEEGSTISVTVSTGIGVTVKDYRGMNITDARDDLAQYPLMQVEVVEEASDSAEPGTVIRQELLQPGDQFGIETADEIRLVYAPYATITIPEDLAGKNIDEAVSILEGMGAQVLTSNLDTTSLSEEEIAQLQTGVVIRSDPEFGSEYTQTEENYIILYYY